MELIIILPYNIIFSRVREIESSRYRAGYYSGVNGLGFLHMENRNETSRT